MMRLVDAATMRELDRRTIEERGLPGLELMERAGEQCAAFLQRKFTAVSHPSALVLAGKGNNGGDGFVVARYLLDAGWRVQVLLLTPPESISGDAASNLNRLPADVVTPVTDEQELQAAWRRFGQVDVLVDALFGTGLSSAVTGLPATAISILNAAALPVLAVDLPSGVEATTGAILGSAVRATWTVTFAAAKYGQILYPGAEFVGQLQVVDIGIPPDLLESAGAIEYLDLEHISERLRPRSRTAHKGSCGQLLLVAGATGMTGAAALAAGSAVRGGAGLVTLAVPASLNQILEIKTTEAMTRPLPDSGFGFLLEENGSDILTLSRERHCLVLGPGIGRQATTQALVRGLLPALDVPLVLDADALFAVAGHCDLLRLRRQPTIITPHPGEMARLAGLTIQEVEADRIGLASRFAASHGCFVLLKGARTVLAAPDGRCAVNGSGNPGMASGGMGDVLAGLLGALLVQEYEPFTACCLAAFLHGLAADLVASRQGEIGMTASDVREALPHAFNTVILGRC